MCSRDTCPDCSHLSVAGVRLMESVRDRHVAGWNKAVADAVPTPQHSKPSVALTSMAAALAAPAAGKSWRITEKAPPPQPSKRASFFTGTLEHARLAGLTDEEIASIAAALTWRRKKGLVTSAVPQSVVRCQRHAARGRPSEGKPCWNRHRLLNGYPWRRKKSPG